MRGLGTVKAVQTFQFKQKFLKLLVGRLVKHD